MSSCTRSRRLPSHNPAFATFYHWISTTASAGSTEANAAMAPADPELTPLQEPMGGAHVELPSNPKEALEVFVNGHAVRIPKGFTVLQAYELEQQILDFSHGLRDLLIKVSTWGSGGDGDLDTAAAAMMTTTSTQGRSSNDDYDIHTRLVTSTWGCDSGRDIDSVL